MEKSRYKRTNLSFNPATMDKVVYDSIYKMWYEAIKGNYETNFSAELDNHKKLLNFFQVGDYFYLTHYLPTNTLEYLSPSIVQVLGYSTEDLDLKKFMSLFHPDDFSFFVNCKNTAVDFLRRLPAVKVPKYKIQYDFRIRKANGEYSRFLQQAIAVQSEDNGGIIRTAVIYTDISHLKTATKSSLSFIGLDGEPSYQDVPVLKNKLIKCRELLSKREKEILNCLIYGDTSQQIADKLCISTQTVSTHRKNILKKTACHSTCDLTRKAIEMGWV